ncbi:CCA tRNA nucleotidyltransferase [Brytella acorum]|uniref:CCA tRNA nucleotidyltransferase n=1 Tax=Brytella acorum TaxID=2959299 RepID=UPI003743D79B
MPVNPENLLAALPERRGLDHLWRSLPDARLVGGCVRDLLCGAPVHDYDLATPEAPEQVMALLDATGIKVVPTGLAHGTVTAVIAGRPYEITTLRRDEETDGRHAVVRWTRDWAEDAARRDFTINAMSLDRNGQVHDYFGGVDDLAARRVRFVGEASRRIAEDALRILRFFRFDARYGGTVPDGEALAAITSDVSRLGALSAERVAGELLRILEGPRVLDVVARMMECGALSRILAAPHLAPRRLERLMATGAPPDAILRLGVLCDAPDTGERLKLSNGVRARLDAMRQPGFLTPDASDDDLRRALATTRLDWLMDGVWIAQADRLGRADPAWDALRARLAAIPHPVFPLSGRDVLEAGGVAGPGVGAVLRVVEAWWMSEGCRPGRVACLIHLENAMAARTV